MNKSALVAAICGGIIAGHVSSALAGKLGPARLQSKKEYDASLGPKAWAEGIRSDGRTACGYGAYQSIRRDLET